MSNIQRLAATGNKNHRLFAATIVDLMNSQEMREFDGDIQEPKTMDEPTENTEQDSTFTLESFDEETAIYLLKLLDGKMTLA